MPNPFGTTFESLESPTGPVVDSVHEAPYRRLIELIDSGEGQLISLRAPRAGYGKTMLLSRLREKRKSSITIIPIHLADGRRIEGERVLEEVLTQLTESVPGAAGLTKMDLHARRLFAHGLIPMVYSGEVPSQDKDGALASLRERPSEAFDFHNEGAAIAQWTKSQFSVLAPRLSSVLGKASGASTRDTSYWVSRLFDFAIRTPNEPSRTGELMDTVFGPDSRFRSGAGFLDGLGSFLNLITLVEPAVLVLDEVDGLSSDSDSALRTTSSLISLWEAAPRMSVIISVNDDVWESAFAPRLPLGLRDRLEDVVIRLKSLSEDEARSLVKVRSGSEADKLLQELDLSSDSLYPRGVLKAARDAWNDGDFGKKSEPQGSLDDVAKVAVSEDAFNEVLSDKEVAKVEETDKPAEILASKSTAKVELAIAAASKKISLEAESPIKEFEASKSSELANEVKEVVQAEPVVESTAVVAETPVVAAAPAKPKQVYPPIVVRRVSVPKAYDVVRIRPTAPVTPDFSSSADGVAVQQGFQQEVSPAQPESTLVPTSPFAVASQPSQVSPASVAPETVVPAPVKASPEPAHSSPFSVAAAKEEAPPVSSPFEVADAKAPSQESPAPKPESPFNVAPGAVPVSPFTERSASAEAAPAQVNSPFHAIEKSQSESQSILPPIRQTQPTAEAENQAGAPPAPATPPPVAAPQESEQRRAGRVYPSKSPFDVAPTPAASALAPEQPSQTPPVFSAPPVEPVVKSPFEVNLAPQAVPPQPEVPKADADAIDELLRQFREHRDA